MASKALKSPLVRHVATRGYAQAAPAASAEGKFQSCLLPNKTFVAALDNCSPLARVTVAFKAGSRYEPQGDLGLAHVLRSAAGLSTGKSSGFLIQRKLSQIGAAVSASGDREFIYYTLEATQDNLMTAIEYLNSTISCQEFRPWELDDNLPRMKYDIVSLSPQVRAVDLLHKAAYRRGLGNSLFISPKRLGKLSAESLQHFAASNLTAGRCAVTVVGGDLEKATMIAQALVIGDGSGAAPVPSKYQSDELRKEMGGELAHVALAVEGASAGSPQALALAVAAKALGNGPAVKWGDDNTPLAKAVGNIGPFAAAGFSVAYSDSGLLGAVLTVPKDEANSAVKAVAGVLKSLSLREAVVKAAKNQLKMQVLTEAEDGFALSESLAAQGLYTGTARSPSQLASAIDQLSAGDVTKALANASKSGVSMGAAGNLVNVPYVDEL